jgi:hypothetical protein
MNSKVSKLIVMIIAGLLLIVLIACTTTGGQPAVTDEPGEVIAEPTSDEPIPAIPEPTEMAEPPATAEPPTEEATAACPEPTAESQLLRHEAYGYCFLYPLEYDAMGAESAPDAPSLASITLYEDSVLNVEAPLLTVTIEESNGRTAEQAADEVTADLGADFGFTRDEVTIGGETGVVLDNMPGQDLNRSVFVVHDDLLYNLIVYRIGPDYGEIGERAEALYQMVLDSFRFVPVVSGAPLEAGAECPAETAETVLLRNEEQGYCLLYPAEYTAEQPTEGETVLFVGSLMDVEHPKLFINVEDAGERTAQEAADELVAEFQQTMPDLEIERTFGVMVDGAFAERLDKVPGQDLSRQVIFVQNGRLYKLTFVPADEAAGEIYTEMEAFYELVIDSFSFLREG